MKINPRPQLSSTTAVRHPEQCPCTQHISSTITGSHNKTFKEVGCLFQGFLIFASGNFIIGEARKMCFTQLIDRFILGKSSPTSATGLVLTQPSNTKRCQVGGHNFIPSGEPARGSLLLTYSPDAPRTSRTHQPNPFVLQFKRGKHQ